jgi:hypothetical protein
MPVSATGETAVRPVIKYAEWQAAAVGSNEVQPLFQLKAGARVLAAWCRVIVAWAAATTPTFTLGDGASVTGYITDANANEELAGPYDGTGAYLATPNQGKLYLVDDTVDVDYIAGATPGAVNGKVRFYILVLQSDPDVSLP